MYCVLQVPSEIRGMGAPGTGVTGTCELPDVDAGN